jgi:phage tail sheath protein FI
MPTLMSVPAFYVEEIPGFPAVTQVETAVPAFIGYTEKADNNGISLINIPTRISSMLEFIAYFGEQRTIDNDSINVVLDEDNNYAVQSITVANGKFFYLYNSIRLFYDNGGADCYIISAGLFKNNDGTDNTVSSASLSTALLVLQNIDEVTILLFPDAVLIQANAGDEFYQLQKKALEQCASRRNRITILDLYETNSNTWKESIDQFRQKIGTANLKYGAAYTPWVYHAFDIDLPLNAFKNLLKKKDGVTPVLITELSAENSLNQMIRDAVNCVTDFDTIQTMLNSICDATYSGNIPAKASLPLKASSIKERYNQYAIKIAKSHEADVKRNFKYLLSFVRKTAIKFTKISFINPALKNELWMLAASPALWRSAVESLVNIEKNATVLSLTGRANDAAVDTLYGNSAVLKKWLGTAVSSIGNAGGNQVNYEDNSAGAPLTGLALVHVIEADIVVAFNQLMTFAETLLITAKKYRQSTQASLYNDHPLVNAIKKSIQRELSRIPPAGAVAGIYAQVDRTRGVWKPPANVSLVSITDTTVLINDHEQEDLNVDVIAGKSINAIRTFYGRGILIWGARTLAGNDNEWCYISVRRFFNMVEESCKKSTAAFVFEPNDTNTWMKVQGMIENFLTSLWRQGALQGNKPEQAFYVAIGLGRTMTAQDILDGKMIVEIGMAVVRPAEFIILRFYHKMLQG